MTKENNIEKAYNFEASEFNRKMKRITQDRLKRGLPVSFDIPSDATLEDLEEIKAFEAWVMDGQPVEDWPLRIGLYTVYWLYPGPERLKENIISMNKVMNTHVDFPKSFEAYKSAVYDYLTQKLGASEAVARNLMNEYKELFQEFWESKLPVSGAATGMWFGYWSTPKKNIEYSIVEGVNPCLFHDVIQIVRQYLYSGDTVDIHDDYSVTKCYLSSDGLPGFAIEPVGNLISWSQPQVHNRIHTPDRFSSNVFMDYFTIWRYSAWAFGILFWQLLKLAPIERRSVQAVPRGVRAWREKWQSPGRYGRVCR